MVVVDVDEELGVMVVVVEVLLVEVLLVVGTTVVVGGSLGHPQYPYWG